MAYGRIEGEARERAEKELAERYAEIEDSAFCCVACANTRRKQKANGDLEWRRKHCKNHRMMFQIAYNTSPLSEAYWTS
jgi:hypothetical protein